VTTASVAGVTAPRRVVIPVFDRDALEKKRTKLCVCASLSRIFHRQTLLLF
jgi:hypothetical protein